MKITKTLGMLGILVVLAAYVYFYEIKGGEEREKEQAAAEKIIDFEPDSVQRIDIRSVLNQFVFERSGDDWRIIEPVRTGADKSTIDGMLNALKNMKKVRQFTVKESEKKDFGLVGRSSLVIFEYKNGSHDTLRFGDATPVGGNVFVSRDDTLVYTVASHLKNNVTKDLFDWRNKSIAIVKESDVREFRIKNTKGSLRLVREGADWQFLAPKEVKADNISVNALLRKFENGKAKSIVSEALENPRTYNLSQPVYEIELFLGESKARKQIILSKLADNVSYVKDDSRPQVMTVDSLFIRDIDKTFFDLRDKKIVRFDKDATDSVVVMQGDSVLSFSRDTSNTWLLNGAQPVYEWKMNSLLNSVNNLQAEKFLAENAEPDSRYGLNAPQRTILCYQKGALIQRLLLTTAQNQKIAACPVSKVIATVSDNSYQNFEVKPADFLDTSKTETAEGVN